MKLRHAVEIQSQKAVAEIANDIRIDTYEIGSRGDFVWWGTSISMKGELYFMSSWAHHGVEEAVKDVVESARMLHERRDGANREGD